MKQYLLVSFSILCCNLILFAQEAQPYCASHIEMLKEIEKNPDLIYVQEHLEREAASHFEFQQEQTEKSGVVRIIPVVFHVIHQYGKENISREQCQNQLDVLNEDFRKLNADQSTIPSVFASKHDDVEIEFRLATKDPNGKCTDGVVKVAHPWTSGVNPRNNVKSLSYWPNNKYLNIWVVATIHNENGTPGFITGYAQFPGMGSNATDGIVLRADYVGRIEFGSTSGYKGRTATHEVGHWLNLRHIWGDATCGSDYVSDTPTHEDSNSGCPSFPHDANACSGTGSNGEMFMNYMDYTVGSCRRMFTAGQASRMNSALTSYRNTLYTSSNLSATGADGSSCTPVPKADFIANRTVTCVGELIEFKDLSWNGKPTSWSWSFQGGTPATSTDSLPKISYNTPGTYNVTLTSGTTSGNSTPETKTAYITILTKTPAHIASGYSESFEGSAVPNSDWEVKNDGSSGWAQTSSTAYSGSKALKINNSSGMSSGEVSSLVSTGYDLTAIPGTPTLKFKCAYAQKTSSSNDFLKVYYSINCGESWVVRKVLTGAGLASAAEQSTSFTPSSSGDWKEHSVVISPAASYDNVLFKFEFTSGDDQGNNIYIDDINVWGPFGPAGMEELMSLHVNLLLQPNPTKNKAEVSFELAENRSSKLAVYDILGKEQQLITEGNLSKGKHRYVINEKEELPAGIYFVSLWVEGKLFTKKLFIQ